MLIFSKIIYGASPHGSIVDLDNHGQAISFVNIQFPNYPHFLACRLNIGGHLLEVPTSENAYTLQVPIALDTELQKQPILPYSLIIYPRLRPPYGDPIESKMIEQRLGVEFMEPNFKADSTAQRFKAKAKYGIGIQAVVFQRTILLPNFSQLNQVPTAAEEQAVPVYAWSKIKHLAHQYGALEGAVKPITVDATTLETAFKTGIFKLAIKPNCEPNIGQKIPVYANQIFEASFALHSCQNPIYFIEVDDPDFHSLQIDSQYGCNAPKGHDVYLLKLDVVKE